MRWLIAMVIGALAGWLIASVTEEVAIASASGAAIGILATIALIGSRPLHTVVKVASAMAVGCLFGWVASLLTTRMAPAIVIGAAIGVLATMAIATDRPVRSLAKLIGAMAISFTAGWGIGIAVGNHHIGMALAVPISMLLLLPMADTIRLPRRRPF
ncbi:putative membrane protein YfcA [Rhizomicrobium palustre]|uniref:Putative membrane protein YfcA n=1 Tax=Rhizomicrobium palustre TaxID=189966 RepID=A0A846N4C2_9PROT|nr:hypothetical protein [Rhizomicrobium palustre]NIK90061.1 putative membrane protein YfcA [Rhizomicrobium palustre]